MDIVSLLQERLHKTQANGNLSIEAELCFKLGLCLKLSGDLFQSCRYFLAALELSQETERLALGIKCCEELCRVYIYQGSVPHYEYYLNRILSFLAAIKSKSSTPLCLHHVFDALCYAYVTEFSSIREYLLDMLKSFISEIRQWVNDMDMSFELMQSSAFLSVLEQKQLDEVSSNVLKESLVCSQVPTDKFYSSLILGIASMQEGNSEEALEYFEAQNHNAKELQNVPAILTSYHFLLKGHLSKQDLGLATLSFQLLRELCKGKSKICTFLTKDASYLMEMGRKYFSEHNTGSKELSLERIYFKKLLGHDTEMEINLDEAFMQLKKVGIREALYAFGKLYNSRIDLRGRLEGLCEGSNVRSRCFRCRELCLRIENSQAINVSDVLTLSHAAFSDNNESDLMILKDQVLIMQKLLKSAEFGECMGKFLDQLSRGFKDPAEGFDYFSSRKVSKTVMSFVGGNFNMKSRAGEGSTGLQPVLHVRLPSSRIFLPRAVVNEAEDDPDDFISECIGGEQILEIEPTLESISLDSVRLFDFTCLGVNVPQEMLNQLWRTEELRLSCIKGVFHFCGSIKKMVLVLCEISECDLKGCENLKLLQLFFLHIEKLEVHEGTNVERIGCELELEPSLKRMRLC